jgi:hypothetical protein
MNGIPDGIRLVKGYIPWVGQVKRKRAGENWDSCRRMSVGCGYLSCEWTMRDTLFLWIPSPISGVTCF